MIKENFQSFIDLFAGTPIQDYIIGVILLVIAIMTWVLFTWVSRLFSITYVGCNGVIFVIVGCLFASFGIFILVIGLLYEYWLWVAIVIAILVILTIVSKFRQ